MPQDAEDIILYEGQLTTTSTSVYVAPAGYEVVVKAVQFVNITGTAATARLDRVPSGGSDATTEEVDNESVAANATLALPKGGQSEVVVLRPGDALWASSGTASAIDCTISGQLQRV